MVNRMNTLQTQLLADFNAESDITDEFGLIDDYLREPDARLLKHELPALMFEALTCGPCSKGSYWEDIDFVTIIIVENAVIETARSEVKRLISLVRDFLVSDQWRWNNETQIKESGFGIGEFDNKKFRAVGIINFTTHAHLTD